MRPRQIYSRDNLGASEIEGVTLIADPSNSPLQPALRTRTAPPVFLRGQNRPLVNYRPNFRR
jgi:hypothetical protein